MEEVELMEKRINNILMILFSFKGFSESWNALQEETKNKIRDEIRRVIRYG